MPHSGQDEHSARGDEAEEKDDDHGVLVVHEMVSEARAAGGDAAIGELHVETAEEGGYVQGEETVQEAYGCVSATVRRFCLGWRQVLPEGWQPAEEGYKSEE